MSADASGATQLRELAQAATPGPWTLSMIHPDMGGRHQYAMRGPLTGPNGTVFNSVRIRTQDAAFIAAASPDVVLALLARVEEAEAQLAEARRENDEWQDWSNSLAEQMPEEYDGDEAQEALIERWIADLIEARDAAVAQLAALGEPTTEYLLDDEYGKRSVSPTWIAMVRSNGRTDLLARSYQRSVYTGPWVPVGGTEPQEATDA